MKGNEQEGRRGKGQWVPGDDDGGGRGAWLARHSTIEKKDRPHRKRTYAPRPEVVCSGGSLVKVETMVLESMTISVN